MEAVLAWKGSRIALILPQLDVLVRIETPTPRDTERLMQRVSLPCAQGLSFLLHTFVAEVGILQKCKRYRESH